jgi:CHAD domain-containing protein
MRLRLANALDRAEAIVEGWPLPMLTFDQVAAQLARSYRRARWLLPPDWTAAGAQELHELRKRVVVHRHQMDIVEPLWPRFVRMWTAETQRLRDRLGRYQDLLVLERLTGPHQPLARWRSRLAPAIAERKARHLAGAASITARLFIEAPNAVRRRLLGLQTGLQ